MGQSGGPHPGQDDDPTRSRVQTLTYESVTDVIFYLGIDDGGAFRFVDINPAFCRATGLSRSDVVGKPVSEVIPEPSLSLVLSKYGEAVADRRTVRWEEVTPYPTGDKYGEVAVTPVVGADGRVEALVGTVHDVTEARQREQTILALSARIEAAREEERTGIAREIHDQLGQTLTAIKMDLAWMARRATSPDGLSAPALVDKVRETSAVVDETIQQIRRISAELRPGVLDDVGLVAALSWRAGELEKRTGIRCSVESSVADEELCRDVVTAAFRVFEETLTNVARHAAATRVDVRLEEEGGWLVLRVSDDGTGIRSADVESPRSLGLIGIRERARRLHGTASFEPREPTGTTVTLRLPLDDREGSPAARS